MPIKTPTELGKELGKKAKELNQILAEIGFIEDCNQGWRLTQKGKANGGIQNNYKGNLSVYWDENVKNNKILINALNPSIETKDSEELDFRTKFKAEYRTQSGHFVRSRAEVIIADYLYHSYIMFAYERRVPIEADMYCDFFLPKCEVYIEFWGYEDDEKYTTRKRKKIEIYQKESLNLIQIDNKSINNLDDFLPKELLKFGMKI
ncbi:hypothetical protein [Campylobacter geochelonis]|uniref:Uncharacterized protein n=1 Tax=Campylobacter geochelonis TaxID=1780362 RepID=A0A128ERK1_9BACT|nr:hypothetical protein [Campylobacter geochelonis]QKF70909.1 hypothetical protein CGEO_0587 [Campylobacter geochelonis]CZE46941.1 Uncharacterised protein [Campylobacter geochelonis]CZE49047.1 Uncharacterised protein [Campylobacter geochelonis]CZE51244.1 Uncharacterised protein [Campylobacter geochelonis]